jgi:hypothetical protein
VYCFTAIQLFNLFGAIPNFPAYGGESDFSLRTAWFVLAVIPAFLVIGAWVGVLWVRQRRTGFYALVGTLVGTIAYIATLVALTNTIEKLPSRSANVGAILAELAWVLLAIAGLQIGVMISRRP